MCVREVVKVMWSSTERVLGGWQRRMIRRSDQVNQRWRSVGCKRLSVSHGAGAIVQRQIVKKQKAASEGNKTNLKLLNDLETYIKTSVTGYETD